MNIQPKFRSALGLATVLALGACANTNYPSGSSYPTGSNYPSGSTSYPQSTSQSGSYARYGVVQSIELVRQDNTGIGGSGVGAGAVAGAVVGGIIGNQVGSGKGNTAATVIGAAGGALAGHELEKRNRQQADAYRLTLRMSDGTYQTVMQTTAGDIRVGDRVQVAGGVAQRY